MAAAQTPASVTTLSGNGQVFCSCPTVSGTDPNTGTFYPLVVLVKDANNKPIPNATVNWGFTSPNGFGSFFGNVTTTTTAADGTTSNLFIPGGGAQGTASTPPTNFLISATAGTATATFSLTQAYNATGGSGEVQINSNNLPGAYSGNPITANSGQQGFSFNGSNNQSLQISVLTSGGTPVQGASVRLINFQSSPFATCATGQGADPGSVLTDASGNATCNPVFTGTGQGSFVVAVGATILCNCLQDATDLSNIPLYSDSDNAVDFYLKVNTPIPMQVTAAVPSSLTVLSGNGQSATAGQALTSPLVATVNAQGGGTLAGQSVIWTISPATAGSLTNTTTTSDSNGNVTNYLTLSSSAAGTVTVTASLSSNSAIKATFTESAISAVTIGGLTKVSGDAQSAIVSTQFASPIVVQVNSSTGSPVAGIPVTFSASGGAILSSTQVPTGANGQAAVNVTAPATSGAIQVTASASGYTQTFNLTVSPPGPTLTANSFVNAADGQVGSLSPCSLATIYGTGLQSGLQGIVSSNLFGLGGLSTTLGNDTVTFGSTAAPILNVGTVNNQQQITFQVPCSLSAGSNQVTVGVGAGSGSTTVTLLPASPGVFQTNSVLSMSAGLTLPLGVFVRPDGSFVTQANPARKGDTIVAYVTGLGPASPSVGTNNVPLPTAISTATNTLVIGVANAGVPLISAQLSQDLVGVYRVAFQVPSSAPSGNQVFSVGVSTGGKTYYSAGTGIPIQ